MFAKSDLLLFPDFAIGYILVTVINSFAILINVYHLINVLETIYNQLCQAEGMIN